MLLIMPAVLKRNSSKWRLPVNLQGLSAFKHGKAQRNALNVATRYPKHAAKAYQVASFVPNAKVIRSDDEPLV